MDITLEITNTYIADDYEGDPYRIWVGKDGSDREITILTNEDCLPDDNPDQALYRFVDVLYTPNNLSLLTAMYVVKAYDRKQGYYSTKDRIKTLNARTNRKIRNANNKLIRCERILGIGR